MRQIPLIYLLAMLTQILAAQENMESIQMSPSNWETMNGTKAVFETFDDRETLLLNGKVFVKNSQFSNGSIEVDVYAKDSRSFAGIVFRRISGTMEEVYMRMHKSDQVDAVQYTPTYNEDLSWQLYREYQAKIAFKKQGWNNLRINVNKNKTTVYVNDQKVLDVDQLKTGIDEGEIGLFALFENRFSNFKVKKNTTAIKSDSSANNAFDNKGIITEWSLSKAFPNTDEKIDYVDFLNTKYIQVNTEASGLLPIGKFIKKPSSGNFDRNQEAFAIARYIVHSNGNQKRIFSFDYSDKIIIYLNGEPIYSGNNSFRSKGSQFQGHLNIDANNVFLNLENGKNIIHCVIIERANGWGIIGKID